MNNIMISFLTTAIAGFSTIIGIIPCFFNENRKDKIIASSLAFSSGIMLTISIISLIPEATNTISKIYKPLPAFLISAIFIIIGVIISDTLDNAVEKKENNNLYKIGLISTLVLMLHNIPEGITTYLSTTINYSLGYKLAFAIALHNIPEGISIAVPIYYSTKSKKKALFYTIIAGFSELLGALIAFIFFKNQITPFLLSTILAITAGIMIHISIYEFLPNSFSYKKNKVTIYYFVLGILIMFLSEMFIF